MLQKSIPVSTIKSVIVEQMHARSAGDFVLRSAPVISAFAAGPVQANKVYVSPAAFLVDVVTALHELVAAGILLKLDGHAKSIRGGCFRLNVAQAGGNHGKH